MSQTLVPAASVHLLSFACPVCGAHASQTWYLPFLNRITGEDPTPTILTLEEIEKHEAELRKKDSESAKPLLEYLQSCRRMLQGEPFMDDERTHIPSVPALRNVFISKCYTCSSLSIWLHDRLLYPSKIMGPSPNLDLSADVKHDYEEARQILDLSPRGSAALLRLAIEKICIELGAEGDTIDKQIAFLVSKGLPPAVQQALDVVRVIGNEAVHPGVIDLKDDRETAVKLFDLVNFIAEDRISRPKQIEAVYGMIPEGKLEAIAIRNAKALKGK